MKSADTWRMHTEKPEFQDKFQAVVKNKDYTNDQRAATVEKLILDEAVTAGVVKQICITQPRNPNKWGKTLAPWFNDECREAKRELGRMKREYGKGDNRIV
jgi:hypothetical protein